MGPVLPVIRSLAPLAGSPAGLSACQRAACCSLCSLCAPSALLYAGTFRGRRRSASNRPPPALRVYSGLVDACMRATAARPRQRGARCFNTGSHNRCALECTYACSAAPHRLPGTRERPLEGGRPFSRHFRGRRFVGRLSPYTEILLNFLATLLSRSYGHPATSE